MKSNSIWLILLLAVVAIIVVAFVASSISGLKREFKSYTQRAGTVNYFPRFCSKRAIICYIVTLLLVSAIFMNRVMPFQFMLFGIVGVLVFFVYSNRLTSSWWRLDQDRFVKKVFYTALWIRVVYVVFIYFYYIEMTGIPNAYHAGDELLYQEIAGNWYLYGFETFLNQIKAHIAFSDRGYCWWLGIEYRLLSDHVLPARLIKCVIGAYSCVLMYNLAKRNFGEATGRMTAIFYMLMPNAWYYCGVTLKEIEMAFLTILFVERADYMLHSKQIKLSGLLVPAMCILLMFTFRTALGAVMFAALAAALIFSTSKQLEPWKKVLYSMAFVVWMFATVGVEIVQETEELWTNKATNQSVGYEWRANRSNGNEFAKYASASVFAPFIFTLPFSSMVKTPDQENQMMMNGGNFIKNIMSGLTIFALFAMLLSGDWRKHVLPIALTCGYLVVLVFSNFAHSERFHFPILAFELMFAAYGTTLLQNKHKRWIVIWLVAMGIANIGWAWVKLAGRGMA